RLDVPEGTLNVLRQLHLQSVVDRASHGRQEAERWCVGMDAAESAGVTERGQATIATLVCRRTKAIAGIIAHRRSGSDGALNAGSPSGTAKGGIGRVDRLRSTAWVEEADVAGVILVHAQQGVGLDVAHEIDPQHHAS